MLLLLPLRHSLPEWIWKNNMETIATRLFRLVRILLLLLALAVFLLFLNSLGLRIPCIFYEITGLKCPGCGVTRMCLSLLHGNVYAAIYYNKVVPFLLPVLSVIFIRQSYLYVTKGNLSFSKLENLFFITSIIILIIYAVLRNITIFSIF